MYIDDLKFKLKDYNNIPKQKKNKALESKIKIIPSQVAFNRVMYKIGITQRKKQYARLVIDLEYFKSEKFIKNNSIKLTKDNIVFEDFIDERKFKIPKGKTIDIYTRKYRKGIGRHKETVIDVAFILDGEIFIINPIEGWSYLIMSTYEHYRFFLKVSVPELIIIGVKKHPIKYKVFFIRLEL